MPPRRVPEPVQLDRSCRSNADCTVKDVGSCCGRHPDCVNAASPADPEAVQAQCAKQGLMSSCAIREITACTCRQGQCAAADDAGTVP